MKRVCPKHEQAYEVECPYCETTPAEPVQWTWDEHGLIAISYMMAGHDPGDEDDDQHERGAD